MLTKFFDLFKSASISSYWNQNYFLLETLLPFIGNYASIKLGIENFLTV